MASNRDAIIYLYIYQMIATYRVNCGFFGDKQQNYIYKYTQHAHIYSKK